MKNVLDEDQDVIQVLDEHRNGLVDGPNILDVKEYLDLTKVLVVEEFHDEENVPDLDPNGLGFLCLYGVMILDAKHD